MFKKPENKVRNILPRNHISIFFLGSPLIDLTVKVDYEFLKKHNLNADTTYTRNAETEWIFNEIQAYKPKTTIGGSVTNTARIFRKYSQMPKEKITYLGTIGKDSYGNVIKTHLKNENITTHLYESDEFATGKVIVLLNGKSRTLITDLGASKYFPEFFFNEKLVSTPTHIYISAFFISVSFEIIKKICQLKPRICIIMNLGATFLCKKYLEEICYMYEAADVVIGNQDEHIAFAGINNVSENEITKAIEQTSQIYLQNRILIVTRNENPIIVRYADGQIAEFPVRKFNNLYDTNGAGDAFLGGFLVRFLEGKPINVSVQYGIQIVSNFLLDKNANADNT